MLMRVLITFSSVSTECSFKVMVKLKVCQLRQNIKVMEDIGILKIEH